MTAFRKHPPQNRRYDPNLHFPNGPATTGMGMTAPETAMASATKATTGKPMVDSGVRVAPSFPAAEASVPAEPSAPVLSEESGSSGVAAPPFPLPFASLVSTSSVPVGPSPGACSVVAGVNAS